MSYYTLNGAWDKVLEELLPKRKGAKRKAEDQLDREDAEVDSNSEEKSEEAEVKVAEPSQTPSDAAFPPQEPK